MKSAVNLSKVLIVDDSEGFRSTVAEGLAEYGFECFEAGNGEDALRLILEKKPDVIVLDMVMPGMNGLEVTAQIRKMDGHAHMPIIMISGRWSMRDKMAGYQCGVNRYLTKPVEISGLLEEIRTALDRNNV